MQESNDLCVFSARTRSRITSHSVINGYLFSSNIFYVDLKFLALLQSKHLCLVFDAPDNTVSTSPLILAIVISSGEGVLSYKLKPLIMTRTAVLEVRSKSDNQVMSALEELHTLFNQPLTQLSCCT